MQELESAEPKKYWAFISYSSKDRKWGRWLHRRLENYPLPKQFQGLRLADGAVLGKNLRPVFRDRDELAGSSELGPAIKTRLQQSRNLIVLCSKNSARSEWVNREIEGFQSMGGERNILALILDGIPNATSSPEHPDSEECFPEALRFPAEPLAGDLRKEADGKDRGFLKILSGVAQLDFDDLYRRHERAQRSRRMRLAGFATVIILTLAALSFYAFTKKKEAEDLLIQTYVDAAGLAVARADWQRSLPIIEKALAHRPQDPSLRLMYFDSLLGSFRANEATALLEELSTEDLPKEVEGRVRLREGMLLVNVNSEEGRALIEKAIQFPLEPDEEEFCRAILADSLTRSIDHARKALELDPFNNLVYPFLVQKLIMQGRLDEAEKYLDGWSLILPENQETRMVRAQIAVTRDPDRCEEFLETEFRDLEPHVKEMLQFVSQGQAMLAKTVIRDIGLAPDQVRQEGPNLLELSGSFERMKTDSRSVTMKTARNRGLEIDFNKFFSNNGHPVMNLMLPMTLGNSPAMESKAQEFIDKSPSAFTYYVRGLARFRMKRFDEANEDFRLALESPSTYGFEVGRVALEGRILTSIHDDPARASPDHVETVRKLCLSYLANEGPLPVFTSLQAGNWLNGTGNEDAVLLVLQPALENNFTRTDASLVHMVHMLRIGAFERALKIGEGILKKDPENAAVKDLLKEANNLMK